jgi:hypothetical protein
MVIDRSDRMLATNSDERGTGFGCNVTVVTFMGGGAAGTDPADAASLPLHPVRMVASANTPKTATAGFMAVPDCRRDVIDRALRFQMHAAKAPHSRANAAKSTVA